LKNVNFCPEIAKDSPLKYNIHLPQLKLYLFLQITLSIKNTKYFVYIYIYIPVRSKWTSKIYFRYS